jgi:hypothetical protein
MSSFIPPKIVSPFYRNVKRLPRKLKKELNKYCFAPILTIEQKLWYHLYKINQKYHQFLISKMIN